MFLLNSDASEEGHEMRIQIRVHAVATARNDAVSASPSMDNMVGAEARSRLSLLSSLRRSPTSGSMHHSQSITGLNTSGGQLPASGASTPTSVRAPVAASMEGQLLAEALLAVPVQNGMKSTQEYSLTNLKGKEIAKLTICAGALIDEEFRAVPPEPVPVEPKFADFLNFSLSTPGASVWRKYWCVLRDHEILVFDFEYQEKPEVARIPLASLQTLHPSDPELMCAANCIEFVFAPATVSTPWLDTVITVRPYTGELAGYATADSSKRMTDWIDRIAREKARLGPTQQPVPPPRKLANGGKSLGKHVGSNMPGMMVGLNKNSSLRKPVASVGSVALAREVGY
ncbi:hypothetical protein BC832DRAFT_280380 [Gaertneriomyces semiglobifer]|nr:hypothetical protein BC832DRAFT_280380 [Gaertneriomyces semiglobifer]